MIHHIGLEIRPSDLEACITFWQLLGWDQVPRPEGVDAEHGAWLERGGFQIHLQGREQPIVPPDGHPALVDPAIDRTAERLAAAGFEVSERRQHWGARRIFTRCPAGHRVELMAAPPR